MAGSGDPVPSSKFIDYQANAKALDIIVNDEFETFTAGRTGKKLLTLEGLYQEALNSVSGLGLRFPPIRYESGLPVTSRTQTYIYDSGSGDTVYNWVGDLPFTTTGDFENEPGWNIVQYRTKVFKVPETGDLTGVDVAANSNQITVPEYEVGANQLAVFKNGTLLEESDYTETDPKTITITAGFLATDTFIVTGVSILSETKRINVAAGNVILESGETVEQALSELSSGINVYSSFQSAIDADNSDVDVVGTTGYYSGTYFGKGLYLKTGTGTPNETDFGSYFVDAAGNRFELKHQDTVSIEQFGSLDGAGSGARAQAAVDYVGARKIISERENIELDFPVFLDVDNKEWDTSLSSINYIGNSDVYASLPDDPANAVRVDRSVGVINIRGSFDGSNASNVTSSIIDGTSKLTLDDTSWLTAGDDVLLEITYPRKNSPAFMFAAVEDIDGSIVTIDYVFGWAADTCKLHSVNAVKNCVVRVGNITDSGGATADTNYVSGVGVKYAKDYKVYGCDMFNAANPAVNTRYTSNGLLMDSKTFRPRETGAGRGYSVQINESHSVHGDIKGGVNSRHVLDLTYAAYCYLRINNVTSTNGISQIITHGAYEHDNVIVGGSQSGGGIGVNLAASDLSFGKSTKRMTLENFLFTGRFRSQYAEDITVRNSTFLGDDMAIQELEFGGQGDLLLENVKCLDSNVLVRIRPDQARERPMGKATLKNCKFSSEVRFTYYTGDIVIDNCDTVEVTCSQIGGAEDEIPRTFLMKGGNANMRDTWNRIIASKSINVIGTQVHSDAVDRRIRNQAPVVKYIGVDFTGGAGADATSKAGATDPRYLCKYFSLNGVTLTDALNNTSPHFTHENSVDLYFNMNDVFLDGTGTQETVDFVFQNNPANCVKVKLANCEIFGGLNEDSDDPSPRVARIDAVATFVDGGSFSPF